MTTGEYEKLLNKTAFYTQTTIIKGETNGKAINFI